MPGAIGPIDYSTGAESPLKAIQDGFQTGVGIQQAQTKQAADAKAQIASDQMNKDLALVAANPSPEALAQLSIKYPQMSEQFKRSYDMLNTQQQEAKLNQAIPIYAAVNGGNTETAVKLLTQQADGFEAAGKKAEAQQARTMAELVRTNPQIAKTTFGIALSGAMGPEKFAQTFSTLGDQSRAADKAPLENRVLAAKATTDEAGAAVAPTTVRLANANTSSQINERAARLGLDKDKLTSETQLKVQELSQKWGAPTDDARKGINEAAQAAVLAGQTANQWGSLADKATKLDPNMKYASAITNPIRETFGDLKTMRQEYIRLRSSGVAKMLPPGPASDKDIQIALSGFPSENSTGAQLASFSRGMAKISRLEEATNTAKAEWFNAVGHMGKSKADMDIMGVRVPAGSTFVDYSRKFVAKKADDLAQEEVDKTVQNRGYMRFANPQ